jgi:hypothetical protein
METYKVDFQDAQGASLWAGDIEAATLSNAILEALRIAQIPHTADKLKVTSLAHPNALATATRAAKRWIACEHDPARAISAIYDVPDA